jgi:hypothetical protein
MTKRVMKEIDLSTLTPERPWPLQGEPTCAKSFLCASVDGDESKRDVAAIFYEGKGM